MNWPRQPRLPAGQTPGQGSVDRGAPFGLKLAIVTRVDEVNMKVDLKVITGMGFRPEIDSTQTQCGPRSFWGGVPEINSLAIVGYRHKGGKIYDAVILGYLPVGNKSGLRFAPFASENPAAVDPADQETSSEILSPPIRYKRLLLKSGDVGGMSASGAELVLSKDIRMFNRAGDGIELRDADRTLITQAVHRVEADAGIRRISGPIRRGGFYLPDDILRDDGETLKDESEKYYGRDELQTVGPGTEDGGGAKFSNTEGKLNEIFNETDEFPPVTYSNGRRVFYVATSPALSIEDLDLGGAEAFVEDRFEMSHSHDLVPEVLEEIDGFASKPRVPYIERVLGTVAGNSLVSTRGMRQYAKVLKPVLFKGFKDAGPGTFRLIEADRQALAPDTDVWTQAGAFLFRIRDPRNKNDSGFAAAVSKQGKVFLNIPGSSIEDKDTSNISAEVNLSGALKAYIGASTPDRISAFIQLAGALHLDMGRDADGNCVSHVFRGGTKVRYEGNPNSDDVAQSVEVRGKQVLVCSGEVNHQVKGKVIHDVKGIYQEKCDRKSINAFSGYSMNCGEKNELVSGKSQLQYALAVIETIVAGGRVSTILAGGLVQTVAAGAIATTAGAGAMNFAVPAGAFNVIVGTGAISMVTGAGAVTLATGGGAMTLAAGLAMSIAAGAAMSLVSGGPMTLLAPQISLILPGQGVCRGAPGLPAGTPTLCPVMGAPLVGSAVVHCI